MVLDLITLLEFVDVSFPRQIAGKNLASIFGKTGKELFHQIHNRCLAFLVPALAVASVTKLPTVCVPYLFNR